MFNWSKFGNIKEQTGYSVEIIDYIFEKYCKYIISQFDLFLIYKYIHKYPTRRQLKDE